MENIVQEEQVDGSTCKQCCNMLQRSIDSFMNSEPLNLLTLCKLISIMTGDKTSEHKERCQWTVGRCATDVLCFRESYRHQDFVCFSVSFVFHRTKTLQPLTWIKCPAPSPTRPWCWLYLVLHSFFSFTFRCQSFLNPRFRRETESFTPRRGNWKWGLRRIQESDSSRAKRGRAGLLIFLACFTSVSILTMRLSFFWGHWSLCLKLPEKSAWLRLSSSPCSSAIWAGCVFSFRWQ